MEGEGGYKPTLISPKDCLRALQTPLRFLKGIGPKRAARLEALGLRTVEDLLYHLPFRYEDRRGTGKISQAVVGLKGSFVGKLVGLQKKFIPRMRRQILTATLVDGSGSLGLVWYRLKPYMMESLVAGKTFWVHGKVEKGIGAQKRIAHPEFEPLEEGEDELVKEKILPVYLKPTGIPMAAVRRWMELALAYYGSLMPSCLPLSIARRQGLIDLAEAMRQVHCPEKSADIAELNRFSSRAHRSIIFDEFFYLQLGLGLRKRQRKAAAGIPFARRDRSLTQKMQELLPFALTGAQRRVLAEIYEEMERPRPMQRLIQGDVGSGKTIVGWFAAVRAIENGFQALWMAPTELLAEQHYRNLKGFADALGIGSALLTGSLPPGEKRAVLERIEKGEISFVVGTHALIQQGVRVPRLGLGIIDEQHRFGVLQRMALQRLSDEGSSGDRIQPDILLMSATPIPRSLAMVLYGDMEVSFLDEMPPGRIPVVTRLFSEASREEAYRLTREELARGHQAYLVYPLVEPSERLQLRDATRMAVTLAQDQFRAFRVGLIHGRMSAAEREQVMRRFKEGELQLLVATTVIEVGIDVPNATVMMVEHAERFGLSQLHQLRGRVGRGKDPACCLLVHYDGGGPDSLSRLRVMERENDGFKIAEADLQLRGPGELLGTRQSGLPDFRLANLARDASLLLEARREALGWLAEDPALSRPESRALREVLKERWGKRLELGTIG